MHFNTIIRPLVGADLSRPSPIYRPLVHFPTISMKKHFRTPSGTQLIRPPYSKNE
jgi:hypothetical protein